MEIELTGFFREGKRNQRFIGNFCLAGGSRASIHLRLLHELHEFRVQLKARSRLFSIVKPTLSHFVPSGILLPGYAIFSA